MVPITSKRRLNNGVAALVARDPKLADELSFWRGICLMTQNELVDAQHAFGEYWANEELARRKEAELENCRELAQVAGHQYAAVVAGLLAVTTLATVVLQRLM